MSSPRIARGDGSPYVAFRDDRCRMWALVSRDVRWVLVALVLALGEVPTAKWHALWRIIGGG
jgi:hypothetical protein